ncbi:LOW QUALITY PROTEIN: ADP-ribosylation factor-like protein 13B [Xenia sp. Carnegie-2017]|uniref:LOW QUALITY PROTEIN: ADP-ribosylation factor-like protein 13B n=1 Tax=Xenia sp. Carnegie-2017 TaxID=2897299 RepID=UPI001F04290F|nr:LOW QUALITY PROTEIN: ADP-ribosylation factor-like protein 13B [Xenia sp. Carnegie-2017]
MLDFISRCFSRLRKRGCRDVRLLMLGIDNAGKSTIINNLKGEARELTIPTIGFSSAEFKLANFKAIVYDVGGGPRIRGIWKDYYAEIYGMVYVVDASDHQRISESREVLHEALYDPRLAGKPLLLFANKQDITDALSEKNLESQFGLEELANKCNCCYKIFQCTALLNEGRKVDGQIKKGFSWLLHTINEDFTSLKERVLKDTEIQKEADRKERAERLERVRKNREERERAERERETEKSQNENCSSEDNVMFGNVKKSNENICSHVVEQHAKNIDVEQHAKNIDEAHVVETLSENSEQTTNVDSKNEQKKKRKRKAKRNQTAPMEESENNDARVILKPIAWRTPPSSLNGNHSNGRKLEPIRAPLHKNLYSPPSNLNVICEAENVKEVRNHIPVLSRSRSNEVYDVTS